MNRRETIARAAISGVLLALLAGCVEDAKPAQNAKNGQASAGTSAPRERERTEKGGCGKAGCG